MLKAARRKNQVSRYEICSWSCFTLLLLKIPLIIFILFIEMLPSFLQKVEVVAEASRETCVALSDCLHLFTKQEGVGPLELNFYSHWVSHA